MTVGLLRRAIAVYRDVAWAGHDMPLPEIPGNDDEPLKPVLETLIAQGTLTDETLHAGDTATHIYTLRVGNPLYPFMKLVLQEHLVEGHFFLAVDTHDQMFGAEAAGEQEELQAVKRHNLAVKDAVDRAWHAEGLPTAANIKGLVATWPARPSPPNGRHLLLADDDRDIVQTLALLLQARGYQVSVVYDGRRALEVADPAVHHLILMDNEMKDLDGSEACRLLKANPRTARIPVLIATAGALSLEKLTTADGFLVKPFRMELLFSILEQMLGRRERL